MKPPLLQFRLCTLLLAVAAAGVFFGGVAWIWKTHPLVLLAVILYGISGFLVTIIFFGIFMTPVVLFHTLQDLNKWLARKTGEASDPPKCHE